MFQLMRLMGLLFSIFLGLTIAQNDEKCQENEEWGFNCGRDCISTCQGPPEDCQCREPTFIEDWCYGLCLCKKGYIRDQPGGKCVPVEECPRVVQCPENEEFSERKPFCETSCQNKENETSEYTIGCVCKKGYVREGPGGRCVPESCTNVTICQKNERWTTCASCPSFCNETENMICPLYCTTGCNCKPGYIRKSRADPTCIPVNECPCRKNEIFTECGTSCPPTCSEPDRTCFEKRCIRKCICKRGFVVDESTNECIRKSECPKKQK